MSKKVQQLMGKIGLVMTAISVAAYCTVELLNTYSSVSEDNLRFSMILIVSAGISMIACTITILGVFKSRGRLQALLAVCAFVNLLIAILELTSAALSNFLI